MKIELTERPMLYQWDWDRFVKVTLEGDEKVDELHFVNRSVLSEALAMEAKANEHGDILVEVPRQLLVEPGTLCVYPVIYSENGEQTLDTKAFGVFEREKPADYVHGETEVLSYRKISEEMLEQMKKLEEDLQAKMTAPLTAEVGQMLIVEAVENGKPTKWECVDRTHYSEGGGEVVELVNETVEYTGDDGYLVTTPFELVVGETYTVSYDDTEHECVCWQYSNGEITCLILGNGLGLDLEDTGEPFVIAKFVDMGITVFMPYEYIDAEEYPNTIHLVVSGKTKETIKKLDNKYLDMEWIPKKKEVLLLDEIIVKQTSSFGGSVIIIDDTFFNNFIDSNGKKVIVCLDGERYETTIKVLNESGFIEDAVIFAGNASIYGSGMPNTGEPFVIQFGGSFTELVTKEAGEHTISVYELEPNPIPEEFLPESVATKEYAIQKPSIAEVGQIIAVKAVDENGKPTEFEAVEMPSGGGSSSEEWEMIVDFTSTEEVKKIHITEDMNGNPISTKEYYTLVTIPAGTEKATVTLGAGEYRYTNQNFAFDFVNENSGWYTKKKVSDAITTSKNHIFGHFKRTRDVIIKNATKQFYSVDANKFDDGSLQEISSVWGMSNYYSPYPMQDFVILSQSDAQLLPIGTSVKIWGKVE